MNKTKDVIFSAAIKCFSEKGYNKTTMEEIALKAGVAKGTLYYNFENKEEIFKYIIEEGMKKIKIKIEETFGKIEDPMEKLRTISRVHLKLVHDNRSLFKVVMGQLWGQEVSQVQFKETIGDYIRYIETFIKEAMNEGCIQKGETLFMAYTFFGNLCSAVMYELIHCEEADVEEVQGKLMSYIFEGIGAK